MFRLLILMIAILTACMLRAEDNVMLWFFNDPDIKGTDGNIYHMADLVPSSMPEDSAVLIRVSAQDGSGDKVYLDLTYQEDTEYGWFDGLVLPSLNPDTNMYDAWKAGPGFANLAGLNLSDGQGGLNTALIFAMEIGLAEFDDNGDVSSWSVLAYSNRDLTNLIDGGHIVSSELSVHGSRDWDGGVFGVPEPSSGLLVLIGGALLALRRRRKAA